MQGIKDIVTRGTQNRVIALSDGIWSKSQESEIRSICQELIGIKIDRVRLSKGRAVITCPSKEMAIKLVDQYKLNRDRRPIKLDSGHSIHFELVSSGPASTSSSASSLSPGGGDGSSSSLNGSISSSGTYPNSSIEMPLHLDWHPGYSSKKPMISLPISVSREIVSKLEKYGKISPDQLYLRIWIQNESDMSVSLTDYIRKHESSYRPKSGHNGSPLVNIDEDGVIPVGDDSSSSSTLSGSHSRSSQRTNPNVSSGTKYNVSNGLMNGSVNALRGTHARTSQVRLVPRNRNTKSSGSSGANLFDEESRQSSQVAVSHPLLGSQSQPQIDLSSSASPPVSMVASSSKRSKKGSKGKSKGTLKKKKARKRVSPANSSNGSIQIVPDLRQNGLTTHAFSVPTNHFNIPGSTNPAAATAAVMTSAIPSQINLLTQSSANSFTPAATAQHQLNLSVLDARNELLLADMTPGTQTITSHLVGLQPQTAAGQTTTAGGPSAATLGRMFASNHVGTSLSNAGNATTQAKKKFYPTGIQPLPQLNSLPNHAPFSLFETPFQTPSALPGTTPVLTPGPFMMAESGSMDLTGLSGINGLTGMTTNGVGILPAPSPASLTGAGSLSASLRRHAQAQASQPHLTFGSNGLTTTAATQGLLTNDGMTLVSPSSLVGTPSAASQQPPQTHLSVHYRNPLTSNPANTMAGGGSHPPPSGLMPQPFYRSNTHAILHPVNGLNANGRSRPNGSSLRSYGHSVPSTGGSRMMPPPVNVNVGSSSSTSPNHNSPVIMLNNLNEDQIECQALFQLCGVYGQVQRVKISYHRRDTAFVQMADPRQAQMVVENLDRIQLHGKMIHVSLSRMNRVKLPKLESPRTIEEFPDAYKLTRDYNDSKYHRYARGLDANGCKSSLSTEESVDGNKFRSGQPSKILHLSNLPKRSSPEELSNFLGGEECIMAIEYDPLSSTQAYAKCVSLDAACQVLIERNKAQFGDCEIRILFALQGMLSSDMKKQQTSQQANRSSTVSGGDGRPTPVSGGRTDGGPSGATPGGPSSPAYLRQSLRGGPPLSRGSTGTFGGSSASPPSWQMYGVRPNTGSTIPPSHRTSMAGMTLGIHSPQPNLYGDKSSQMTFYQP